MSYLVLARKWRPRRFAELVGQQHVVRALTNALESDRVHHAFLFTGTRGVGKTSIARIFAKSLNCEQGTSAEPCGDCSACRDIDAGRFLDLLEIDAASNTGVDDVRDLIENAQYMPSRGRMKVYLIDEVHMLSKQAFNALLKTLEEPPAHVKFLLATTDPQKLPVTVLSRCLQFNLKRLDPGQIEGQIVRILEAEGIAFEPDAVRLLAKAADGSLRDGLSLLDQGIAFSGSGGERALQADAIAEMLGSVDRHRIGALLQALAGGDGEGLLAEIAKLAELSPDWGGVLDALAEALHRVQVRQLVPGSEVEAEGIDLHTLACDLRPELVQLWYQIALQGRRDLPLAPSPQVGFEMSLLRMLAFRPVATAAEGAGITTSTQPANARAANMRSDSTDAGPLRQVRAQPSSSATAHAVAPPVAAPGPVQPTASAGAASVTSDQAEMSGTADQAAPQSTPQPGHESVDAISDSEHWLRLVAACGAKGPAGQLAAHASFVGYSDGVLRLSLPPADELLRTPALVKQLEHCLADQLGRAPQIRFETAPAVAETLHQRGERERDSRQAAAESVFLSDPHVQKLMREQGARLVPDSIRPLDD